MLIRATFLEGYDCPSYRGGKRSETRAMAVTVDQFSKALVASGLMAAEELMSLWAEIPVGDRPTKSEDFAQLLVVQGKLTSFQAQELLAGRGGRLVMGDYVVLTEIGAGGMGQVYKARHRRMKRIVALKVMSNAAMRDEAAVKRFQREVQAAARLEHENIVTAYASGEAGEVKYLVMQFVDGGDLSQLVKSEGPLPLERAIDYVLQVAAGLAFAHRAGIIHRDIKPANLLLDKKGQVKILDMGLARIEGGEDGLTATEQVMGTVDYMSPEQATNTKTADARADIYALGCTLWYLLTGKKVYESDSLIGRLMAHRDAPLPSLVKARDDAPWPLEQALHKMIAKRPQDRFQTMDEVLAALEPFAPNGGGSRSGMGSSIGMGSGPQNAEYSAFLKTVGPAVKTDVKAAPSKTNLNIDATQQLSRAEIATDPKSTLAPPPRNVASAKPQPKGAGGKRGPSLKLITAGIGGFALLMLLSVRIIIQKPDGSVTKIEAPQGSSITVATSPTPAETKTKTLAATAPGSLSPPPKEVPGAVAAITTQPGGETIDLLALVDPQRDSIHGTWRREGTTLLTYARQFTRIQIPYHPPKNYVVQAVLEPLGDNISTGINFILPIAGRRVMLGLDGGGNNKHLSGLNELGGKSIFDKTSPNPTAKSAVLFRRNVRSSVRIMVAENRITATCDGLTIVDWNGDPALLTLSSQWETPDRQALALGCWTEVFRVHTLTLTPN